MGMTIQVLGSGSWGTALAALLARNGHQVTLLGRDPDEIEDIRSRHRNERYLPGFDLPTSLHAGLLDEIEEVDLHVLAVPAHAIREVASRAAPMARLAVVAAKGLEPESGRLMTDVTSEAMPGVHVGALSGPNLATEIVQGIPTAALAAFQVEEVAMKVRQAFSAPTFRVYVTGDVTGVELCGALKNVLAIGAGISDGLGFGNNTKGALLSRGLKEMIRLGTAMGARLDTMIGIAGVGDLFATATSNLSRNYRVGKAVGEGKSLEEIIEGLGQVAEGVQTAIAVKVLADRHEVQLPVFGAIEKVLRGEVPARQAVSLLMERDTPYEHDRF